ncbi:MAG: hypothetical protein IPK97_04030 [Ahniella sp.]|nr:hypothetical protein [Ahniella sp.]
MKTKYLLPMLLLAGLAACSKDGATPPAASEPAQAAAETTPASAEVAAPAADPAMVADAGVIGIAECDDFLTAYEACVADKVPAESRIVLTEGMTQWRQSWKDMATNEAMRPLLPEVCKRARESAQAASSAYDCKF